MTTQVAVSVSGAAALIIPPVADARVVLVSLVLGATALDTIQIYEGTAQVQRMVIGKDLSKTGYTPLHVEG